MQSPRQLVIGAMKVHSGVESVNDVWLHRECVQFVQHNAAALCHPFAHHSFLWLT